MDGTQRRIKNSLQRKLSVWLSLTILGMALAAGILAFILAFYEAHDLQDDMLRQVAALYSRHPMELSFTDKTTGEVYENEEDSRMFVQRLPADHVTLALQGAALPLDLPLTLHDGLQTVYIGAQSYRVLVKKLSGGERLAVAQKTDDRDEAARTSALSTLLPLLLLLPILLFMAAYLIRKLFKPMTALADEIDRRGGGELHPMAAEHLPTEIQPFAEAINGLLARVAQAMEAQRRFVADAAHELRSPLTALSLQAERMLEADMSPGARERADTLHAGIRRNKALLEQLLALARVQTEGDTVAAKLSLQQIFTRALEDLMPLAEAKNIDIGVLGGADAQVVADETELLMLAKNLVDNAIRYTPRGGRIDLMARELSDGVELTVEDSGPGIPPEARERVFDSFYRVPGSGETGSGLGLSIVRAIASKLGATVSLAFADEHAKKGLRVSVKFSLPS